MATDIGWIILTKQETGHWDPDWDGKLYLTKEEADDECAEAASALGAAFVMQAIVSATFLPADGSTDG